MLIEAKPFALGVRAEHPQQLIDSIQYSCDFRDYLPPAPYSIVKQIGGRGMYSLYVSRWSYCALCNSERGWLQMVGHLQNEIKLRQILLELLLN